MNENDFKEILTKAAVETAKDCAIEVYQDGAKGAVKEGGEALQAIVGLFNNIVLYPVKMANLHFRYKLEEFEKDLGDRLNKIPKEKLKTPELSITGPVIEALKYTFDTPDIREMYLNLLTSASNKDFDDRVHPAFVEIIKGMSPIDAQIFKQLGSQNLPLTTLKVVTADGSGQYVDAFPAHFSPSVNSGDYFQTSRSLDNLERLGIVDNNYSATLPKYDYENNAMNHEFVKNRYDRYKETFPGCSLIVLSMGVVHGTDLGAALRKCCLE